MKTVSASPLMKAVTISPIRRTHSVFRYFLPFQSQRQVVTMAIILVVGLPFFGFLLYRFDPDANLVVSLLGGVVGAVSFSLSPMLPAHMQLTTRSEARHFVQALGEHIISLGYVELRSTPTSKRYRSKHPRWLRWDEQEVEIVVSGNAIDVNGPVLSLRLLAWLVERKGL